MDSSNEQFDLDDAQLQAAGLYGDGISELVAQVINTMKKHPGLLKLSTFALQCINALGHCHVSPASSTSSSLSSNLSALAIDSNIAAVPKPTPDEYERLSYYNGITGDDDHPELVYRSDFATKLFPKPSGRHFHLPVKSLRSVYNTALNGVWETVGPEIRDLVKARDIKWSSIDPARFFTHGQLGEDESGVLGPAVIWVGVRPGSTSSDTAHAVSQEILELLQRNGVNDAVVEWREAVPQKLAGSPLMRHVNSDNPTHHVRRFLTALLSIPLATEEMEEEDAQGTLTLWFRENKDKSGNPSKRVFGVSNCHVLRKNTAVEWEQKGGARLNPVRVCGARRFQRGIDQIKRAISDHSLMADYWARGLVKLQDQGVQDKETKKSITRTQQKLDDENDAVAELQELYKEVTGRWSVNRNIGHLQYAAPITVDVEGDTPYTLDWAVFLAAEAKVRPEFEGNVIDLGSKYSAPELTEMFYARGNDIPTTFKFPDQRKLRIVGCATKKDLGIPTKIDREGHQYFVVGKDGSTTDLTIGHYAGLVSFTLSEVGVESVELGIYNVGLKSTEPFSAKGDSGSLVWYTKNGKAYIVGQVHSGQNKGGSTSNHVTYCTPGWYLLEQIRKKFPYADFYCNTWPA